MSDEVNDPVPAVETPSNDVPANTEAPPFQPNAGNAGNDALEKLKARIQAGELLLALRCPCGHTMGVGVPKDFYAYQGARVIASRSIGILLPMLADHLELLAERLARADRERGGNGEHAKTVPGADEIIKAYHNHPCEYREVAPPVAEPLPVADFDPSPTNVPSATPSDPQQEGRSA